MDPLLRTAGSTLAGCRRTLLFIRYGGTTLPNIAAVGTARRKRDNGDRLSRFYQAISDAANVSYEAVVR